MTAQRGAIAAVRGGQSWGAEGEWGEMHILRAPRLGLPDIPNIARRLGVERQEGDSACSKQRPPPRCEVTWGVSS